MSNFTSVFPLTQSFLFCSFVPIDFRLCRWSEFSVTFFWFCWLCTFISNIKSPRKMSRKRDILRYFLNTWCKCVQNIEQGYYLHNSFSWPSVIADHRQCMEYHLYLLFWLPIPFSVSINTKKLKLIEFIQFNSKVL